MKWMRKVLSCLLRILIKDLWGEREKQASPEEKREILSWFKAREQQAILIQYEAVAADLPLGVSKFGGCPDVPADFVWPRYAALEQGFFKRQEQERPLAFLAQFDLDDLADFDSAGLLPRTGHLSFFYECVSMPWGWSLKDKGCARVLYFPPETPLYRRPLPEDLEATSRIPAQKPGFSEVISLPSFEYLPEEMAAGLDEEFYDEIRPFSAEGQCRLLGYPDLIQDNTMEIECQMAFMGLECGRRTLLTAEQQAEFEAGQADWILLFQMGTLHDATKGFELMFGDGGLLYFWIRKQDLAALHFDDVWTILQST